MTALAGIAFEERRTDEAERVFELAQDTIGLSERHRTPPYPNTYALWYAYAAKSNDTVVRIIEEKLAKGGGFSQYDIDQLYQAHLAPPTDWDAHHTVQHGLEKELSDVISLIEKTSQSNEVFAREMDRFEKISATVPVPEQLQAIVESLLSENANFTRFTRELTDELKKSQEQVKNLKRNLEDLKVEANIDALTRVVNRRGFDSELTQAIVQTQATGQDLCLALCDIDHFKKINDTHGHSVGDVVLKAFASILKQNVKGRDTVARYGGEEFAIILPETSLIKAHNLMITIKNRIANTDILVGKNKDRIGSLTASFGVSRFEPGMGFEELVDRADTKLYEAKNSGRNAVRTHGIS